jgi:hypothetical protein
MTMGHKTDESRESGQAKLYELNLADGQRWQFDIAEELRQWGEKLAAIMQLPEYSGDTGEVQTLVITREKQTETALLKQGGGQQPGGGLSRPVKWDVVDLKLIRFMRQANDSSIVCDLGDEQDWETEFIKMQQVLFPVFERAVGNGGFPFHAALVRRAVIGQWPAVGKEEPFSASSGDSKGHEDLAVKDDPGCLLAASGGGGKSTCARRIPPPWQALSDDLALVLREKSGSYRVHPFPTWSDYYWRRSENTWDVHTSAPVLAIFFVEQAEKDEVVPMGRGEAAILINALAAQMLQPGMLYLEEQQRKILRLKLFENTVAVARSVPAYLLKVSLDGEFWVEMDKALGL